MHWFLLVLLAATGSSAVRLGGGEGASSSEPGAGSSSGASPSSRPSRAPFKGAQKAVEARILHIRFGSSQLVEINENSFVLSCDRLRARGFRLAQVSGQQVWLHSASSGPSLVDFGQLKAEDRAAVFGGRLELLRFDRYGSRGSELAAAAAAGAPFVSVRYTLDGRRSELTKARNATMRTMSTLAPPEAEVAPEPAEEEEEVMEEVLEEGGEEHIRLPSKWAEELRAEALERLNVFEAGSWPGAWSTFGKAPIDGRHRARAFVDEQARTLVYVLDDGRLQGLASERLGASLAGWLRKLSFSVRRLELELALAGLEGPLERLLDTVGRGQPSQLRLEEGQQVALAAADALVRRLAAALAL